MKTKVIQLIFIFLLSISLVSSLECPFGLTNDPYPGNCGRYTDENKDGFCDYSQDISQNSSTQTENQQTLEKTTYYSWQISLALVFLYILSIFLYKKRIYSEITHKKIWNILLLLTFLVTAITSMVFILKFDFGISLFSINLSRAHIEWGLAMIIISLFHALWHLPYWKSYLK